MSRSAADTARLFQIIRGQDRRDPRSQPYPTQGRDAVWPPKNVTVGIPDTFFFEVCDDAVRAGYDAFVDVLRQAGAQTKHVRLPSAELAQTVGYQVLFTEAAVTHAEHASRLKDYDPVLVQRMHAGLLTSAADYLRALQFRHELQLELSDVFRDVDVIALPAAPSTAPNLDELTVNINGRKFPLYEAQSRSTMLCNLSGVPGLVLPTGLDEGGCPTSVQLVAPPFREDVALTLALGFQELTDSHCALPPLLERETAS